MVVVQFMKFPSSVIVHLVPSVVAVLQLTLSGNFSSSVIMYIVISIPSVVAVAAALNTKFRSHAAYMNYKE